MVWQAASHGTLILSVAVGLPRAVGIECVPRWFSTLDYLKTSHLSIMLPSFLILVTQNVISYPRIKSRHNNYLNNLCQNYPLLFSCILAVEGLSNWRIQGRLIYYCIKCLKLTVYLVWTWLSVIKLGFSCRNRALLRMTKATFHSTKVKMPFEKVWTKVSLT